MEKTINKAFLKNLSKLSRISGIYKITSPSGRVYIGQSVNLYERIKSYFEPKGAPNQILLRRSFLKYGVENHTIEILEACSVDLLNDRERHYQELYKNILLNCKLTKSGDKSGEMSQTTKDNISVSLKGTEKSFKHLKKKVYQYSRSGEFIKEWESLREASRQMNISSSAICRAIQTDSNNKTAKGFLWSYTCLEKLIELIQ